MANRVLNDGTGFCDLWFEVRPDAFVCAKNWHDATTVQGVEWRGVPYRSVRDMYPNLFDVTHKYPRF